MGENNRLENILRARQLWRDREDNKRFIRESNFQARSKRSPLAQLATLDDRLGFNVGAKRERARLNAYAV